MSEAPPTPTAESAAAPACPYCLGVIAPGEAREQCPSCHAAYHCECWKENDGCAVYGCAKVPVVESRRAIEIPMSYWGQENKPCPSCGQQILAAAMRCRHCGTTFASARPQDATEFKTTTAIADRLPEVRRTLIWIFVLSVIPFTAPVGAVWGLVWYRNNEPEVALLPPLFGALRKIGLIASIALTTALVVTTLLFIVVRAT